MHNKKRCTVEDGTGQALVFFSGDCCRSWLKLPANVWKILQDNVLPHEGEFVYLSSVKKKGIFESNFNLVKGSKDQKLFSFDPEIFFKTEITVSGSQCGQSDPIALLRQLRPPAATVARHR
jgi:hypothetical protein